MQCNQGRSKEKLGAQRIASSEGKRQASSILGEDKKPLPVEGLAARGSNSGARTSAPTKMNGALMIDPALEGLSEQRTWAKGKVRREWLRKWIG